MTPISLLKYTNHPRFAFVKNQVVDLVITMNQRSPIFRLSPGIAEKLHDGVIMWYVAHSFICLDVLYACLSGRYPTQGLELPAVESSAFPKIQQSNRGWFDAVQSSER